MNKKMTHIRCPPWFVWTLDNGIRRLIHNPKRMFCKYLKRGTSVVDLGCGSGTFTLDIAKMVGPRGKVIAVDIQQEMLDMIKKKAEGLGNIKYHKCGANIGLKEKVDVIIAFWMFHEVKTQQRYMKDLKSMMKKGSRFLLVEPKVHVSGREFEEEVNMAIKLGLKVKERPKIFFSRAVVLTL